MVVEATLRSWVGAPSDGGEVGLPLGVNFLEPHFVQDHRHQLWVPNREEMSRYTGLPVQVRPGRLRVAAFGGSTMATPRPNGPAWQLAALLSLGTNGRSDLINAGGNGFGSTRIRMAVEELCQRRLDAILLYTGHNEFMEHKYTLGRSPIWHIAVSDALKRHWYSWAWAASLMGHNRPPVEGAIQRLYDAPMQDGERATLLARLRRSLTEIAKLIQQHKVTAVWVLPASNLTTPPHETRLTSSAGEAGTVGHRALWALIREAREAVSGGRPEHALVVIDRLLKSEPGLATAWHIRGTALGRLNRPKQALAALRRARDLDRNLRRATSAQREVMAAVATKHGISIVDAEQVLLKADTDRYLNGRFTSDAMHLTPEGYRWVAVEVYRAFSKKLGTLAPAESVVHRLPTPGHSLASILGPNRRIVEAPITHVLSSPPP
jgi:lysophospholipase L1-like esterase